MKKYGSTSQGGMGKVQNGHLYIRYSTVQPQLSELVGTTKKRLDNRGFGKLRLCIIKFIHENN